MMHAATLAVFFLSVFFGPWWLMAGISVVLLAEWSDWLPVFIGAALVDSMFGTPLAGVGFPFLYVGTFSILILAESYFRSRILG